jgi:hypothetical protein
MHGQVLHSVFQIPPDTHKELLITPPMSPLFFFQCSCVVCR